MDASGDAAGPASLTNPAGCAPLGLAPNPNLQPGLVPYDLTRGGSLFRFRDSGKINQYAFYVQDSYNLGNLTLNGGLRIDQYNGLSEATGVEPRFGGSYLIKRSGTVLRVSYSRTFETPYNENLLLSSASGVGGLANNVFGAYASVPLKPGTRNQYNTGIQQTIGRYLIVDASYFWKFTDTAYDFDVLFNTPITFPISWRKSKLDGVAGRRLHHQHERLSGAVDAGPHARPFLRPGDRRFDFQLAGGLQRLPHRSRRGVRADGEPALPALQGRSVDRFHVALRQRRGGRQRARSGLGAGAHRRPAGGHRLLLRQPVRHAESTRSRVALRLTAPPAW